MQTSVGLLLTAFTTANIVLTIISLTTPHWINWPLSISSGLWERCAAGNCIKNTEFSDPVRTVQAFLIIAIVFLSINVLLCLVAIKKDSHIKHVPYLFGVAAISLVIAMSVYTGKFKVDPNLGTSWYGYSYDLGWVSFVMALAGTVISSILAKISGYTPI